MKEKLKNIYSLTFCSILSLQILCCFISQNVNSVASRFTSLASFLLLGLFILMQLYTGIMEEKRLSLKILLKDKYLVLTCLASLLALVNLFLIGSNKGALLTAADMLMAFYILPDLTLDKKHRFFCFGLLSSLLIWWYCHVRWEFNFNMTGFIFMLTCFAVLLLLEELKTKGLSYLGFVQVTALITATLLCLLYHARCVLAGMLIFCLLYLLCPLIAKNKYLSSLLILLSTLGSLLFTGLYILLDRLGLKLTILYKDILSGRQDIWLELWQAFCRTPLTGIGSSYKLKSFFIFEVHNGMLDLLIVHGLPVFLCILILMYRALYQKLYVQNKNTALLPRRLRISLSAVFAILFTSFFENFFINSPYLLIVLLLLSSEY